MNSHLIGDKGATWQMGKVAFSKVLGGDFLRGPGVKAQPSNIRGMGSISGWGTKVPHAMGVAKIKKKKNIK